MREHFSRAAQNIAKHGDTDIFPFPIENYAFYDKREKLVDLLMEMNSHFADFITSNPPSNINALTPINYTGFRWATQLDPFWNAYFLGLVLSIASNIEAARIPAVENVVFSYRYKWSDDNSDIFDTRYNWRSFMEHSVELAKSSKFVVSCDISEFYPRVNHHRLENALKQLGPIGDQPKRIMEFLSNFSNTYSFGLPVGGPAARCSPSASMRQI